MNRLQQLMATCATGALMVCAGQAHGQTSQSNPPASAQQGASTSSPANATDQATKRAEETKQDTEAASTGSIGEVVVTAVPHGASLQNLGVSASVYTDDRRNLVGITTANDIINFEPSASLNGEFLSLRGVNRTLTSSFGPPPGISVLVDGIYTDSPDYLSQPDFFSDRVEVLRGPQGTTGGRNAIGGEVDVVSKRPTPDFYEEGRVGYTNYSYWYADAAFSGPITDTLGFRIDDAYGDQPSGDGFFKNLASKVRPGSGSSNLADAQLQWTPNSNFKLWGRLQNFGSDNAASYGATPGEYPGLTSLPGSAFPTVEGTRCPELDCLAPNVATELAPNSNPTSRNPYVIDVNTVGYAKLKDDWTYTTQATWTLPGATVEYTGGYSQYTYDSLSDADGTALTAAPWDTQIAVDTETKRFYQNELDIKSPDNQRLRWSAGVFQYWQNYKQVFQTEEPNNPDLSFPTLGGVPAAPNPQRDIYYQSPKSTTESEAVYGQLDYNLTDTLRLTGGLRYTWDATQSSVRIREIFDTAGVFQDPGLGSLDVSPTASNPSSAKGSWSDWSGKFGVEWRPEPKTLIYASAAKGYKSGGMVLTDILPIPTVGPETLYDYEAGIKRTFGSTLLVDADVYYYDYHNLQEIFSVQNPANGIISTDLASAQRARTYGFELESVWSPIKDFHLTFNYSYLNARFLRFDPAAGSSFVDFSQSSPSGCNTGPTPQVQCTGVAHANLNGNTLPQAPANKVTVNPLYTFHTPIGSLSLSATYAYIDQQYYSIFNSPDFLAKSYYDLDLRALYQPIQGHYTFIVYAKNVTNQLQKVNDSTGAFNQGPNNLVPPGGVFATRGQTTFFTTGPMVVGVELQARF
jgi:iron complex outermembrane receptor protein